MIGFAMCGSFCNMSAAFTQLVALKEQYKDIIPIMSYNVYNTDTRFGKAKDLIDKVESCTSNKIVHTLVDAEPLGPKTRLDCLCVCPCTGNTLAKLANGICDTPVCLACKAHLRNDRPLVIALATNDGLCGNAENLGKMLSRRNVYFVPLRQDDALKKPRSLVCDFERLAETIEYALKGKQIQPIMI